MSGKIIFYDTNSLNPRDAARFLRFVLEHKEQSARDIVDTWNKYSNGIHQHVFLNEKERDATSD